jgi:hypothetical protein
VRLIALELLLGHLAPLGVWLVSLSRLCGKWFAYRPTSGI